MPISKLVILFVCLLRLKLQLVKWKTDYDTYSNITKSKLIRYNNSKARYEGFCFQIC